MVLMSEHNRALPEVLRQDDSIRAEAKLAIGLSDFQHCTKNLIEGLTRSSKAKFTPGGGGGGNSQKNWVGVCGLLPKTLTLFMTKICDIPYPIYDLTFKSKPSSDQ